MAKTPTEAAAGAGVHAGELSRARRARAHRRQVVGVRHPRARRRANAALQRAAKPSGRHQSAHVDGDAARSGARRTRRAHGLPRSAAARGVRAHAARRDAASARARAGGVVRRASRSRSTPRARRTMRATARHAQHPPSARFVAGACHPARDVWSRSEPAYTRLSRPGSFRATARSIADAAGNTATARAPDPGPSQRCLRVRARLRVGLDRATGCGPSGLCARGDRVARTDTRTQSAVRRFE